VQRTRRDVDCQALDEIVCQTIAEQVHARRADEEESPQGEETAEHAEAVARDDDTGREQGGRTDDRCEEEPVLFGIAVDRRSLRGAIQHDGRAVHLFAGMTYDERVVIAQEEVDHKTNGIKAFCPLLAGIDLAGCVVTADAMHGQRDHATFLVEEKQADYLLFVKVNQPRLYDAIARIEEDSWSEPYSETGKDHGRMETRSTQAAPPPADLSAFPYAAQLVRIFRKVDDAKTNTAPWTKTAYAITSCAAKQARHRRLATGARGHWAIENGLH
jgi:predicted transposase YbfD/YdcC